MQLSTQVSAENVNEALRLFRVSTVSAASSGRVTGDLSGLSKSEMEEIEDVCSFVKRMLPIGARTPQKRLMEELVEKRGYTRFSVRKAVQVLLVRGEVKHLFQQKFIQRVI